MTAPGHARGRSSNAGIDARARYGNDLIALMWAAGHEKGVSPEASARVIDLLLAHGAILDDTDNRGRTALMIAADLGYADVVEILVHRGADRAKKGHDGKTAFDLAANSAVREKLKAERKGGLHLFLVHVARTHEETNKIQTPELNAVFFCLDVSAAPTMINDRGDNVVNRSQRLMRSMRLFVEMSTGVLLHT